MPSRPLGTPDFHRCPKHAIPSELRSFSMACVTVLHLHPGFFTGQHAVPFRRSALDALEFAVPNSLAMQRRVSCVSPTALPVSDASALQTCRLHQPATAQLPSAQEKPFGSNVREASCGLKESGGWMRRRTPSHQIAHGISAS